MDSRPCIWDGAAGDFMVSVRYWVSVLHFHIRSTSRTHEWSALIIIIIIIIISYRRKHYSGSRFSFLGAYRFPSCITTA